MIIIIIIVIIIIKQMDQRTRIMTMHKALHPWDDVDRLYVSRKKGGRGLASIEDSVDDSKTIYKNTKDNSLQPIQAKLRTRWTTQWQWLGNKNGKENNFTGALND